MADPNWMTVEGRLITVDGDATFWTTVTITEEYVQSLGLLAEA